MQFNGPQIINQGTPSLSLNGFSRRPVVLPCINRRNYERREIGLVDTMTPPASPAANH